MPERLGQIVSRFAIKYQSLTAHTEEAGALCQLWVPQHTPGGARLTTQGAPFAILGSEDALTLYRYYTGKYQPQCEGAGMATSCPIIRVYANLQPGSCISGDSNSTADAGHFDRRSAAQLANVHSSLLLAVYDALQHHEPSQPPCCVLELVQQQKDVDFTTAVSVLQAVAQEGGFWIPELASAVPLHSSQDGTHNSKWLVAGSEAMAVDAPDCMQQQQQQQRRGRDRRTSVIYTEHLVHDRSLPLTAANFACLEAMPSLSPARSLQPSYQHAAVAAAAAAAIAGNSRLTSSFAASQQQQMHWEMPAPMQQANSSSSDVSRSSSIGVWAHSAMNNSSSCDARWQQQHFDELLLSNMQQSRRSSFDGPGSVHSVAHRSSCWDSSLGANGKVRAVVKVGGAFKRAGAAGAWEYVGGAQKVMVLPRAAAFDELLGLLSSRAAASAAGNNLMQIKYALPGMAGSLIDLACSEDLDNMWDEWDEFIASSSNGAARLQLYVDAAASSTHSSGGSSSGGHRQLQPPTPGSSSNTGSEFAATVAAAAAALSAASMPAGGRSCSWDDEPVASAFGTVDAHVLVPLCSSKQQQQELQPSPWLGLHTVSVSDKECDAAGAAGDEEQFVTCFDLTSALDGDPDVKAVLAAIAAEKAAGKPVVGDVQHSNKYHQQQQQQQQQEQHKGDTELHQLVTQLQGQVELIMPHELRVVRFIGGGAFGEVYLCKWHGTEVAVKCLSPSLLASSCCSSSSGSSSSSYAVGAAAELLKEAATMAGMHHPHVMSAIGVVLPPSGVNDAADDCGSADSAGSGGIRPGGFVQGPAVVCEYLSAGSLQSCINSGAEWLRSDMAKVKVMLDTARGLSYLHSKHVVHFDLKSANLLFTIRDRTPTVKVADFGLSKHRHQTYVTGVDSMRGTLPWIAPEIIKNPELVTEAADVYSFGVIMWELWAMQEPFAGVHIHALLHQLTMQGGLSLAVPGSAAWGAKSAPPEPAPGWSQLMQRCWSVDPAGRPTSKQLVSELEEVMAAVRRAKR